MKRFFLIGCLMFLLVSCTQTTLLPSSETSSSMHYTTGTYFLWRLRVINHFRNLDLSPFQVTKVKAFSGDNSEVMNFDAFELIQIFQLVPAFFIDPAYNSMFPSYTGLAIDYEIHLEFGNQDLFIRLHQTETTYSQISILHLIDDELIESMTISSRDVYSSFSALLAILTHQQTLSY